jgi:hypothetical protein
MELPRAISLLTMQDWIESDSEGLTASSDPCIQSCKSLCRLPDSYRS